jgi:hypothetical protein
MWRNANRRLIIQAGLGIKKDPISKITDTGRAGRVAQHKAQVQPPSAADK